MTIKQDVLTDLMAAREHLDEAIKRVQAVPDGLPTEGTLKEHTQRWLDVYAVVKATMLTPPRDTLQGAVDLLACSVDMTVAALTVLKGRG